MEDEKKEILDIIKSLDKNQLIKLSDSLDNDLKSLKELIKIRIELM